MENREIEKARNQLEAAFVYGQDSVFSQALLLGRYEIALNWKAIDDYLPIYLEGLSRRHSAGGKTLSHSRQPDSGDSPSLTAQEGKRTGPKSTLPGDVVR